MNETIGVTNISCKFVWYTLCKYIIPCNPNIAFVFLLASQCEYSNWDGDGDAMGQIWNWLFNPPIGFNDAPEIFGPEAAGGDEANDPRMLGFALTSSFFTLDRG